MGAIASQITSRTIVYSIVIQTQIKENIKAPRYWLLWGEFTGEFPAQMASYAENVSIWWRQHENEWQNCTFKIFATFPRPQCVNSLRLGDAYATLSQKMACRLFGTKSLSEQMPAYCRLKPKEQSQWILIDIPTSFHSRKCLSKYRLQDGDHFDSVSMC